MGAFEKTILVTGGAGFIGANFVDYYAKARPEVRIVDLDALTYAAHPAAFAAQSRLPNVVTVEGDIGNATLLAELFDAYAISGVIHFAAESHVDNSIADPVRFVRTNVMGTAALLDAALRAWSRKGELQTARFHHISTDEVFGSLGENEPWRLFTEDSPYAPTSPYAASKASADLLVLSYIKTFGMNATISHSSNNFGPWQHKEKFIPTVLAKCLARETIPLYGTGKNVRDWIWVTDHCRAVAAIFERAPAGGRYVVSARCEKSNDETARALCRALDALSPWPGHRYEELIGHVADRPGHDFRYASDPAKIENELGWKPQAAFESALFETVRWYLAHGFDV